MNTISIKYSFFLHVVEISLFIILLKKQPPQKIHMKFSELNLTNLKTNFLLIQFDLKRLFIFFRKQLYIDLIFQSVDR